MYRTAKKPGYMFRAVVAWCIFNLILFATLGAVVWIMQGYLNAWFVQIPLLVGIIVSEWIIMSETIAPVVKDWITQEQEVKDERRG